MPAIALPEFDETETQVATPFSFSMHSPPSSGLERMFCVNDERETKSGGRTGYLVEPATGTPVDGGGWFRGAW